LSSLLEIKFPAASLIPCRAAHWLRQPDPAAEPAALQAHDTRHFVGRLAQAPPNLN
jgi:hypothetical protein